MWQHVRGSLGLPLVVSAVVLAAGCANDAVESLQRDVAQLRQDLNGVTLAVNRSRGDSETAVGQVDRRTRTESAEVTRQTSALAVRLDNLAAELGRVSARQDETTARIDALQRQLAARPAPAPPAPPAAAPAPSPGTAPPTAPPAPSSSQAPPVITPAPARDAAPGPGADQAYQAAYLDFTKGSYPLAISGFREFVRRYPDSPRADEAQYLVGESYFSLARAGAGAGRADQAKSDLEQAVQEFRRVILNYPRGAKVPTALYKEGLALVELKQPRLARARLQYLVDHFPQSEEAPLARERLANLPGG